MDLAYVIPNRAPTAEDVRDHLRAHGFVGAARRPRGRRRSRPLRKNQRRITHNPYIHLGTSGRTGPFWITTGKQGGTNYQLTGYYQEYPNGYPMMGAAMSRDEVRAKYFRFVYLNQPDTYGNPDRAASSIPISLEHAVRFASLGKSYQNSLNEAKRIIEQTSDERTRELGTRLYNEADHDISQLTGKDILAEQARLQAEFQRIETLVSSVDVEAEREREALDKYALERGGWTGQTLYATGAFGVPVQKYATKGVVAAEIAGKKALEAGKWYFNMQKWGLVVAGIAVAAYAYRSFLK